MLFDKLAFLPGLALFRPGLFFSQKVSGSPGWCTKMCYF